MANAATRDERVARINTGTTQTPIWTLMGTGFSTLDEALNPKVESTQYISDSSSTTSVTGYEPQFSFEGDVIKNDAVIELLRAMGATLATGAGCEVEVVVYDAWEENVTTKQAPAQKFTMAVAMDSTASGSGGEKLGFSGTLHAVGDPIQGYFDLVTLTWSTVAES